MQVMTTLPQEDLNAVPEAARAAEAAGFDLIATMENRYEPFMPLAVSAISTKRIGLGTAVAIAFPRSPMVVANTCWDLQKASKGRFVLGIGPQIKPHNEKRFSTPWSAPAPRLPQKKERTCSHRPERRPPQQRSRLGCRSRRRRC